MKKLCFNTKNIFTKQVRFYGILNPNFHLLYKDILESEKFLFNSERVGYGYGGAFS